MSMRNSLTLCAVAVLGLAWVAPAQADLVGYWNFDEDSGTTFADTADGPGAGAPYNGTVYDPHNNGAGLGAEGKFGNAIQLTADAKVGSRGVVSSPFMSDNNLTGSHARTYSMWFNHNHTYTGNDPGIQLISAPGGIGSDQMFMICLQGWNGQRRIVPMIHQRGQWGDPSTIGDLGVWNHIVLAYDAGTNFSALRIYVNGQDLGPPVNTEDDPVLNTAAGDFGVGGVADGGWTNYAGRIDDLGAWNEALSAGQAMAMYNILSPNEEALGDYTVDKMQTLFDVFDTGTADTVTSDVGDLTWEKFTGTSGTEGDVQHLGGDEYVVWFDGASGVKTVPPGVDGDLDGDGDVDLLDFGTFQANFTGPGGGMTVNPEPATLALVGLGGLGLLLRRRKARR